jgi:hypothetical protein
MAETGEAVPHPLQRLRVVVPGTGGGAEDARSEYVGRGPVGQAQAEVDVLLPSAVGVTPKHVN